MKRIWWNVLAWAVFPFVPRTGRPDFRGFWWGVLRLIVLKRDGWRCRECGWEPEYASGRWLEIHHRTEVHKGGSNRPSNLITLCTECHRRKHGAT